MAVSFNFPTEDLMFCVPFNIISATSRQWKGDDERLYNEATYSYK